MEEIKVTKQIRTFAVFTWGDVKDGLPKVGGTEAVENKDPKSLEIDPRVIHFYFGDQSILTDESGRTYTTSDGFYDSISPLIYCGKAFTIAKALEKFTPDDWRYHMILDYQKTGYDKISICASGFRRNRRKWNNIRRIYG